MEHEKESSSNSSPLTPEQRAEALKVAEEFKREAEKFLTGKNYVPVDTKLGFKIELSGKEFLKQVMTDFKDADLVAAYDGHSDEEDLRSTTRYTYVFYHDRVMEHRRSKTTTELDTGGVSVETSDPIVLEADAPKIQYLLDAIKGGTSVF